MANSNSLALNNQVVYPVFAAFLTSLTKVVRDVPGFPKLLDWQLLAIMQEDGELTFSRLYKTFNKCGQTHSNFMYYSALNRLTDQGFAQLTYRTQGRKWAITPRGRQRLLELDAAVQKYLNKKAG